VHKEVYRHMDFLSGCPVEAQNLAVAFTASQASKQRQTVEIGGPGRT